MLSIWFYNIIMLWINNLFYLTKQFNVWLFSQFRLLSIATLIPLYTMPWCYQRVAGFGFTGHKDIVWLINILCETKTSPIQCFLDVWMYIFGNQKRLFIMGWIIWMYSGDPKTGCAQFSNGQPCFGFRMVRFSNSIRKPDKNIWFLNGLD